MNRWLAKLARSRVLGALVAGAGFALAAPPTNVYPALWVGMAGLAWLLGDGLWQATDAGGGPIRKGPWHATEPTADPSSSGPWQATDSSAAPASDDPRLATDSKSSPPPASPRQATESPKPKKHLAKWLRLVLDGGARGLAFGLAANLVALHFVPAVITRFTPLPWAAGALALALLAAFEGLRWAVAAIACRAFARLGVPPWAAFPIGVYAGTFVPTVFPWSAAGGVTPWPAMVQLADVIGERGVTALMALSAALLADALRTRGRPRALRLAAAIALPLATLAHGALRIRAIDARDAAAPRLPVALIEPSIGATERWDAHNARAILQELWTLTQRAESRGAALTIWPESAFPYVVAHASRHAPVGDKSILGPGVHGPVLTGVVLRGGKDDTYNSAVVAYADGTLSEPQDKVDLLWFGETVPLADKIAWIRRTFARGVGLSPGDHVATLRVGAARAVVLNCFEDTLPDAGRRMTLGALAATGAPPNLLVNVTNDAWFSGSPESELHLRLAALRAVEQRRDLVRAVNFGPTTWVDAAGRVRARWEPPLPGVLMTTPALVEGPPTFYGRFGDWPLGLALAAGVAAAAVAKRRVARRAIAERSSNDQDRAPLARVTSSGDEEE